MEPRSVCSTTWFRSGSWHQQGPHPRHLVMAASPAPAAPGPLRESVPTRVFRVQRGFWRADLSLPGLDQRLRGRRRVLWPHDIGFEIYEFVFRNPLILYLNSILYATVFTWWDGCRPWPAARRIASASAIGGTWRDDVLRRRRSRCFIRTGNRSCCDGRTAARRCMAVRVHRRWHPDLPSHRLPLIIADRPVRCRVDESFGRWSICTIRKRCADIASPLPDLRDFEHQQHHRGADASQPHPQRLAGQDARRDRGRAPARLSVHSALLREGHHAQAATMQRRPDGRLEVPTSRDRG